MHHVPKSIRELLYLVRRSQGGVIKAVQGMKDINESALCLTTACSFWMQDRNCLLCGDLKYLSWWWLKMSHSVQCRFYSVILQCATLRHLKNGLWRIVLF